jgi:hypothetical protein
MLAALVLPAVLLAPHRTGSLGATAVLYPGAAREPGLTEQRCTELNIILWPMRWLLAQRRSTEAFVVISETGAHLDLHCCGCSAQERLPWGDVTKDQQCRTLQREAVVELSQQHRNRKIAGLTVVTLFDHCMLWSDFCGASVHVAHWIGV